MSPTGNVDNLGAMSQANVDKSAGHGVEKFFRHVEPETGRRYTLSDTTAPGGPSPEKRNPYYEFLGIKRYSRFSEERMKQLYDEGRIVQTKPGTVPRQKRYLDEMPGMPLGTWWDDIQPVQVHGAERLGYPTQKSLALLERIIDASSTPGDIVLDPFRGCGTSAWSIDPSASGSPAADVVRAVRSGVPSDRG